MRRFLIFILTVMLLFSIAVVVTFYGLLGSEEIEYQEVLMEENGRTVRGLLGMPKNAKGSLPAVIIIHGGAGGNWKATESVAKSEDVKKIIEMGFVILSVDYGSKGTLFKNVVGKIELVGDDIADTVVAYHYLCSLDFVDKKRIFTLGGSHGGFVSLVMGMLSDIDLAGVIEFYGPTNLTAAAIYMNCSITDENRSQLIFWSPVTLAKNYTEPVLIIHGSNDKLIPIDQAYNLVDVLNKTGGTYYFYKYPEEHGFMFDPDATYKDAAWEHVYEFLEEYGKL